MKKRKVPVILVNARLSDRSFSGYKRLKFFSKPLFLTFKKICSQSEEDARRFIGIGVLPDRISVTGNIKFDQEFHPVTNREIEKLRRSLHIQSQQKILLAGSTHKGEELILQKTLSKAKRYFDELLLIVAPRDPVRAKSVGRIFQSSGFSVALLNEFDLTGNRTIVKGEGSRKKFDVIVVDIIGILKKLYALADIAFVGGSLVNRGGHNPLEPAVFSKPILFGPDMSNFAHISKLLLESGGAMRVSDGQGFLETIILLLEDDHRVKEMGQSALNVYWANKGALEKTLTVIEAYL